jgi:hypothetical protein
MEMRTKGDDMVAPGDMLTPVEREALAHLKSHHTREPWEDALIAALDRLAPVPKPAEPRVSELVAKMRDHAERLRETRQFGAAHEATYWADELEAALGRERKERGPRIRALRQPICLILEAGANSGATPGENASNIVALVGGALGELP